jgi:uncharacterized protein (DUF934 family)
MPTLIDRHGVRADDWAAFDGDASALAPDTKVLLPLDAWREYRDTWLARGTPVGVILEPADDPFALRDDLPKLALIAIRFPHFTDGRGYSIARQLRQRLGYAGELRALGDVLRDQIFFYARVGFDSFALRDDQQAAECVAALADFTEVYQASTDRGPLFERRAAVGAHAATAGAAASNAGAARAGAGVLDVA